MSSVANWSYTARATIWPKIDIESEYPGNYYGKPFHIWCDYQGGVTDRRNGLGFEKVIKNIFWTEYDGAKIGDRILIGFSEIEDPLDAGADEVVHVTRYADTFERLAEDFAIITGV